MNRTSACREARWWLTGGLPESLDPYGGMIPLPGLTHTKTPCRLPVIA